MRNLPSRITKLQRCLLFGLAVSVLAPVGCRSTRSGIANVPGLGWVGPRDESIRLGNWDESSASGVPTPSQDAVPQITSQSAPNKPLKSEPRKSYPLDPKPDVAKRSWGSDAAKDAGKELYRDLETPTSNAESATALSDAEGGSSYPDTGYPSPFARETEASPGGYTSRDFDRAAEDTKPDRGFYNESPEDDRSTRPDSRFADADVSNDPAGEQLDTRERYSRFQDQSADTYEAGVNAASEATANTDQWADDFDSTARDSESLADRAKDALQDSVADDRFGGTQDAYDQPDTYDHDLTDGVAERANGLARDLGGRTQGATRGLQAGADRFGEAALGAVGAAQNKLSKTFESAQDNLGSATKPLQNAYGEATRRSGGLLDRGREAFNGLGQDNGIQDLDPGFDRTRDSISEGAERAGEAVDDLRSDDLDIASPYNSDVPQSPPRRTVKPWRPGSTGTYPAAESLDQTRTASPYGVTPVSFPGEYRSSDRRLTPAYR